MPLRLITVSSLTIAFALVGTAQAKTIYASGDWALDDSQPGVAGKGNCVAATATYLGNQGAYSLNLVLDKSGNRPLELMIRPFRSPSKALAFQVAIESGKIYGFAKLPRTAKGEDTFWNLPMGTEDFLAQLKGAKQLNVQSTNELGELPFSLSGATAVLTQLEKRCGAKPALNTIRFEKMFLSFEDEALDLAAVDSARATILRDLVAKGAGAYRLLDTAEVDLVTLDANRVKFEKEQVSLPGEIEQTKKKGIPALQSARGDIQAALDRALVDISITQASLVAQEKLLAAAQAAVTQAKAKRQPQATKLDALTAQNLADQERQTKAEASLAELDARAELAEQKELAELTTKRPALVTELEAAQQAAQLSLAAITKFRLAIGFDALDLAVKQAEEKVLPLQAAIAALKTTQATREQWVKDQTKARDEADKRIATAKEDLAKKIAHLAEIPAWLQKYPAERKSLEGKIEQAKQGLAVVAQEYAGQLPRVKR